jgi:ribonuclease-3
MDEERLRHAYAIIGRTFDDPHLLETALTHPSYAAEHADADTYDRLEFLGDAVLGFIVSDYLFGAHLEALEGELTRRKHGAVSGETLAQVAEELGLGDLVLLGRGADAMGERLRSSILENTMEAVIAAVFLDGGLQPAREFVVRVLGDRLCEETIPVADVKSALQQLTQSADGSLPEYRVIEQSGPPHDRRFTVAVHLHGQEIGRGSGSSKQSAEKEAAASALTSLGSGKTGDRPRS